MQAGYVLVLAVVAALLPAGLRATDDLQDQVDALKEALSAVGRQVQLQQLYSEEQTRASGQSGLKLIRSTATSPTSYNMPHFAGPTSVANMHNHGNNIRTIGLGELSIVMNGVEFRTRHNDYRLYQSSATSSDAGAYDPIEFPDVPPAVLKKATVEEQTAELREWFKAFADQNHSVRDYRPYFPPVLCYLEAAWTDSDASSIEESFESDRHFLDATSWQDMLEKVRFCSQTGHKDNKENYAYLPTSIIGIDENGHPSFAQWNYRIMCHKLSKDLPTNRLHVVDDLKSRMKSHPNGLSLDRYKLKRAARFQLNKVDQAAWVDKPDSSCNFLDALMYEIPGMDNHPGDLVDDAFGKTALEVDRVNGGVLRSSQYHRLYRVGEAGANGLDVLARGWSDSSLYMAMNTRPNIVPLELTQCNKRGAACVTYSQRWSYAIPLEIIYLTPLGKWNPLDIEYKGDASSDLGMTVTQGPNGAKRTGMKNPDKAYNGTNSKTFYRTPTALFHAEGDSDPADTTKDFVYVLDRQGVVQGVSASGHRIFLPAIPGIGEIRQRYPIMPVHAEGTITWREMEAVKDVVLEPTRYQGVKKEAEPEQPAAATAPPDEDPVTEEAPLAAADLLQLLEDRIAQGDYPLVHMYTGANSDDGHVHYFTLEPEDLTGLVVDDVWATATTSSAGGHSHAISVKRTVGTTNFRYAIARLDGINDTGGHGRLLKIEAVL